ncbi:hypothetical protein ACTHTQ_11395, partial [Neisseria sp. P0020.S003]|uniref:hypothetical protein n=1 Tax=Neisseria sp. P0020.S003 TaxID=3436808 RepID=UPI003F7F0B6D
VYDFLASVGRAVGACVKAGAFLDRTKALEEGDEEFAGGGVCSQGKKGRAGGKEEKNRPKKGATKFRRVFEWFESKRGLRVVGGRRGEESLMELELGKKMGTDDKETGKKTKSGKEGLKGTLRIGKRV